MTDLPFELSERTRAEHFPFESRFVTVQGHRIHYIDEGSGPTLLLLHGNPTWSFLYRHLVLRLRDRFRCVAVDHPGFGLSVAGPGYDFMPASHAAVLEAFVLALDLRDFGMMVQDWGGPTGLWMAARQAERVAGLIVGNTWAWPIDGDPHFERFSKLMGGPIGAFSIAREHLVVCFACTLRALEPRESAALLLKEVNGFTVSETAEILGCSFGQAKSWLQAARAALRARFAETCALVSQQGVCHQCVQLDSFFDADRGDPLAGTSRTLDDRLAVLRERKESTLGPWHRAMMRLVDEVLGMERGTHEIRPRAGGIESL